MKRKIFSVFFALVLACSLGLVTAVPVAAQEAPSVTLVIPENVYRPAEFVASSTTTNPVDGDNYTNVRFNITVSGPEAFTGSTPRADIFTITQTDDPKGLQGFNETFALVGGNFTGYWGPEGGFPLDAPYTATSNFTVLMTDGGTAPVGNYDITVELVDLAGEPVTLASAMDGFSLSADTLYVGAGQQFTTIQDAVNAADPGDTIIVAAGTYDEYVDIDIPLTLSGQPGAIVKPSTLVDAPIIEINADGVTVEGFEVDGTGLTPTEVWAGIGTWSGCTGVTIQGNTVHNIVNNVDSGLGIGLWRGDGEIFEDILIEGNIVYNTDRMGIYIGAISGDWLLSDNITIRDNDVYDTMLHANVGETFPGGCGGIAIDAAKGSTVEGNTVYDTGTESNPMPGIYIKGSAEGNVIQYNDTYGNDIGIAVYTHAPEEVNYSGGTPTPPEVHFNDIHENTSYGLRVIDTRPVDATLNWWGDISGPNFGAYEGTEDRHYPYGNPGGTGDNVTGNVDKVPWLTRVFETVLDDNIAYFGYPMVHLDTGWNTLSTPIALDGLAKWVDSEDKSRTGVDTWGDYVWLGDGLNIHATSPAYAFDPTVTPPWVPLIGDNASYPLTPCDAIYVRMAEPDIAPVLYSPDMSVPSKELYAGWNLVGLADWEHRGDVGWGPWKKENVNLGTAANVALTTVFMVTGDRTGYSLVVSPPMNQNPWSFVREATVRSDVAGGDGHYYHQYDHLFRTKGYWVFMENGPDILAGFTFTPMALD